MVRFFVNKTTIISKWIYQSPSILQRKFDHIYPAQSFQDRRAPTHSANTPVYVKFEDLKRNEKNFFGFPFPFCIISAVNNGDSFRRQTGPFRWWIQHVFQPDYCTTVFAWQVGNSDEKEINIILLKVTQLLKNKKVSFGKFIVRNTSFVFRFAHLFIRKFQIDINCLKFGIAESK